MARRRRASSRAVNPSLVSINVTSVPLQPPRTALFKQDSNILVHWWSPKLDGAPPTLLLFIPGNPGVVDFYTHFLDTIQDLDTSGTLAILAFSHIGHAPF
ncbi:hypothetical protein OG21DRAFT_1480037 [Imleria badia]|nr:hypothetical protein OG21DRAFT_1480037 [Imleria badia]